MCDEKHYEELEKKVRELEKEQKELISTVNKSSKEVIAMVQHFLDDMKEVKGAVDAVEKSVEVHNEKADELVDIMESVEGFFKTLGWIGKAIKWIGAIAISLIATWQAFEAFLKLKGL